MSLFTVNYTNIKCVQSFPYNVRNEGEYLGFDEHFRTTSVREHSYCYDR